MKLFYHKTECGNFGDDLNPWLWEKVFPEFFDNESDVIFVGIGTILDKRIEGFDRKIIFGSGVRGMKSVPSVDHTWEIYAVRGLLSSNALGIESKHAINDPAIIVKNYFNFNLNKKYAVSYMPYFRSAMTENWNSLCEEIGINYIDPRSPVDRCLEDISQSSFLITEAMHGAIIADSFRVPWSPVFAYSHLHEKDVSNFKWCDWLSTLGVRFEPIIIPNLWSNDGKMKTFSYNLKNYIKRKIIISKLSKIIKHQCYYLSDEKLLNNCSERYYEEIERFKIKHFK